MADMMLSYIPGQMNYISNKRFDLNSRTSLATTNQLCHTRLLNMFGCDYLISKLTDQEENWISCYGKFLVFSGNCLPRNLLSNLLQGTSLLQSQGCWQILGSAVDTRLILEPGPCQLLLAQGLVSHAAITIYRRQNKAAS